MSDITTYLDDLFRYMDVYETRYPEFQNEAFFQTYNGIYAVFQALRQQRNEAVAVDQIFLKKIKESPVTSSDLRQLTIQIMISYFESEADVDGQSGQSYAYVRSLRPVKQDVAFFENNLIKLLFQEGALNNNFKLNAFFLREMARFLQKFGKSLKSDLAPEAFLAMPDPRKFLELERRRREFGSELLKDRGSLEFHLRQVGAFTKLGQSRRLYQQYLKEWSYLVTTTFWSRVKGRLAQAWGKVKGAFSSWSFFRLVVTQRSPAYAFYTVVIILFLALAILVPIWWNHYADSKLDQFRQRIEEVR
jgi:hypothetical protein